MPRGPPRDGQLGPALPHHEEGRCRPGQALPRSGRTWLWDSFLFSKGKTVCRLSLSALYNSQGEDIFRELPLHQEETEGARGRALSSPGRPPFGSEIARGHG